MTKRHIVGRTSSERRFSGRNEEGASQVIARRGGALALICLMSAFVVGCGETPPPAPAIVAPAISPDQLVGKWGFAAYHKDDGSGPHHQGGGGPVQPALRHQQGAQLADL